MTRGIHSETLFLAIDQGGHASRALVFDREGNVLASAHVPVATRRPQAYRVEHDAMELRESVRTAVGEALIALGARAADVASAGMATQRSSIVCWDRVTGAPLSPVISWQDTRAADWLRGLESHAAEVRARTGLRLSAHYGASKLRWCLDNLAAVHEARAKGQLCCGPLASFLTRGLVQAMSSRGAVQPGVWDLADPANASRTLLWNLTQHDWDADLLTLFGVPRGVLPSCVPTRYAYGDITVENHKIPLTLVTGDQSAALFALGPPSEDMIYINLGTGAFLQQVRGGSPPDHPGLLRSVVYAQGQRVWSALEGTVNGAGSALSWFAAQEGLEETAIDLETWLRAPDPIPVFVNGVGGLGSPFWAAHLQPRFVGEGSRDARGRAVAESILFLLNANLTAFRDAGITPRALAVSGGLARSDGLCQNLADLADMPVRRARVSEATARGLAQLMSGFALPAPTGATLFTPQANPRLLARQAAWRKAVDRALETPG